MIFITFDVLFQEVKKEHTAFQTFSSQIVKMIISLSFLEYSIYETLFLSEIQVI